LSSKQLTRSTAECLSQLAGVDNRHFFGQDIPLQLRQHVQRETAFFCQCLQALTPLFPKPPYIVEEYALAFLYAHSIHHLKSFNFKYF
jgi:hypothetical protein